MTIMADEADYVIGVDTHKDTHSAALLSATAETLREVTVASTPAGFQKLLDTASSFTGRRLWAVEGTGSFGAGLARFLLDRGESVVEVERPKRTNRKAGAKSDALDAVRAAREVLSGHATATPRLGSMNSQLRALLAARRSAVHAAVKASQQLDGLAVWAPEPLGSRLRGLSVPHLVSRCKRLRVPCGADHETATVVGVMRSLATRVEQLQTEAADHLHQIKTIVSDIRPDLLKVFGVGPIVAAVVLCAWSHPGRVRSEAAFATLGGVAPIPASSGKVVRHRLNRSGDRDLNCALHTIVLTRIQHDTATKEYVARRRAEGKSDREIRRCLKRYVARQLFRLLEATPAHLT